MPNPFSAPPGVPPQFRSPRRRRMAKLQRACQWLHTRKAAFPQQIGLARRFNASRCHVIAPGADTRVSGLGRCARPTRVGSAAAGGARPAVRWLLSRRRAAGAPSGPAESPCRRPLAIRFLNRSCAQARWCAQHRTAKEAGADSNLTIDGMSLPHHTCPWGCGTVGAPGEGRSRRSRRQRSIG